jgi:hypothetical protein
MWTCVCVRKGNLRGVRGTVMVVAGPQIVVGVKQGDKGADACWVSCWMRGELWMFGPC